MRVRELGTGRMAEVYGGTGNSEGNTEPDGCIPGGTAGLLSGRT